MAEKGKSSNSEGGGVASRTDDSGIVRVDFAFKRELARKVEGNLANFCYQCGACVGDCPAATYSDAFNPRKIMLEVLYGLEDELIKEESVAWLCTNCYNCHERCPQEVKPVEVIISLKNMPADRGIYPETAKRIIHTFETIGRTTPGGPVSEVTGHDSHHGDVPLHDVRSRVPGEGGAG